MTVATLTNANVHRQKVVMLGAPSVGKTSLVRQFVHQVFDDEYHSTLGVKVDRKNVQVDGQTVNLLLWDVHGETDGIVVTASYLQGAHAAILVFDATRPDTVITCLELGQRVLAQSPNVSLHLVANKTDLNVDWSRLADHIPVDRRAAVLSTSAKTGEGVHELFVAIAADATATGR